MKGERLPAKGRRDLIKAAAAVGLLPGASVAAALHPAKPGRASITSDRVARAYRIREEAAERQRRRGPSRHAANDDHARFPDGLAAFTKGLPHDGLGIVLAEPYAQLTRALTSGRPEDFAKVRIGKVKKLVNPQAAYAYALEGLDPHQPTVPPAPAIDSAEAAADLIELYWQSVLRDVPFDQYGENALAQRAAADLAPLSGFRGPKDAGTDGLFRGATRGDLVGPYVSQFLWMDIPFGANTLSQRIRTAAPGVDYGTTFKRWLALQNGDISGRNTWRPATRYILDGRDLGEWVRKDFTYQAFLGAALILLFTTGLNGMSHPLNPYTYSENQAGFCTFGEAHVLDLVARVANETLKAVWHQKWLVHMRLRPEEMAGRVHMHTSGRVRHPLHSDLFGSRALDAVASATGGHLLSQAYPEGCPLHPAYPAGHAGIAGACVTVLKAFFDEKAPLPLPVVPNADGSALQRYAGPALTVGGELDKLAWNIAMGRNFAGIHYRSDASSALALGEEVAIELLRDMSPCFNEGPGYFSFTRFNGEVANLAGA